MNHAQDRVFRCRECGSWRLYVGKPCPTCTRNQVIAWIATQQATDRHCPTCTCEEQIP